MHTPHQQMSELGFKSPLPDPRAGASCTAVNFLQSPCSVHLCVGAEARSQIITLPNLSRKCAHVVTHIFAALLMSVNDCKSTMSIDFGIKKNLVNRQNCKTDPRLMKTDCIN